MAAKPERCRGGRLPDRQKADEVKTGVVQKIANVLKTALADIHFAELDFGDDAADIAGKRVAGTAQDLVFGGLGIERQEVRRRAAACGVCDQRIEPIGDDPAQLDAAAARRTEIEIDSEQMHITLGEFGAELAQRGEAGVGIDVQRGLAVDVGKAGRDDDQLAAIVLSRLVNRRNRVGVGLVQHLDKIIGEGGRARESVIAPTSADMMQDDFRAGRHALRIVSSRAVHSMLWVFQADNVGLTE